MHAKRLRSEKLKAKAMHGVTYLFPFITESMAVEVLDVTLMEEVVAGMCLNVRSELDLLYTIVAWIKKQEYQVRDDNLGSSCIRNPIFLRSRGTD